MNTILLICLFGLFGEVLGLSCIPKNSKKDFDVTRTALNNLESFLSNTVTTIKDKVKTINSKVKKLNNELIPMEDDCTSEFFFR